jgi:ABC-2 type transport system permease protein
LFSEEKKRGTMELLLTSPITDMQIVLGKFISALSFLVVLLASTLVQVAFLYVYGSPVSGPILTAYLGLLLFGMSIVAIGMFISSLTENQIVAGMVSFGAFMGLWLFDNFSRGVENLKVKSVIDYLSIIGHLDEFLKGILSTTHVVFYLSLTLLGLFLTYRSIDSLRWRG